MVLLIGARMIEMPEGRNKKGPGYFLSQKVKLDIFIKI